MDPAQHVAAYLAAVAQFDEGGLLGIRRLEAKLLVRRAGFGSDVVCALEA